MAKDLITAVILAHNEEKELQDCLRSVRRLTNEILLIDDYSTDKTPEIAQKEGIKVIKRKLDDFCSQRNFALSKVQTAWTLFIDVDERLTPELVEEMKNVIKDKKYDGVKFPRKNIIFGKWIEHSGWYPDYQLHLFKTTKGKYVRKVHEQVEISGEVGELTSPLIHENYQSITQYFQRNFLYTSLEAEKKVKEGYKFAWQDLIKKPLSEFLRRFFAEEGFKDGVHGLALSLLQAFLELLVYVKIWEMEGFQQEQTAGVFKELDRATKEIDFWITSKSGNPIRKILRKFQ